MSHVYAPLQDDPWRQQLQGMAPPVHVPAPQPHWRQQHNSQPQQYGQQLYDQQPLQQAPYDYQQQFSGRNPATSQSCAKQDPGGGSHMYGSTSGGYRDAHSIRFGNVATTRDRWASTTR